VIAISDEGQIAGSSWGRDRALCRQIGRELDRIVDHIEKEGLT